MQLPTASLKVPVAILLLLIIVTVFYYGVRDLAVTPVTSQTETHSTTPAQERIIITGKNLSFGQQSQYRKLAEGQTEQLEPESFVKLNSHESEINITLPGGSKIICGGSGELCISKDGFKTRDAHFRSRFITTPGRKLRIVVPGIVLGIRGTTIDFDLKDGRGEIRLVEGAITVDFDDFSRLPANMKPGEQLTIEESSITLSSAESDSERPREKPAEPAESAGQESFVEPETLPAKPSEALENLNIYQN